MPDEATRARQSELEARHRDLTKPVPPLGSTPESLRSIKGFENITDAMLEERATFSLKDKMTAAGFAPSVTRGRTLEVNLAALSKDELLNLADALLTEASRRSEGAE